MMRTRTFLTFAAALTGALTIASCSKQDNPRNDTPSPVRFSGHIAAPAAVAADTYAAGDKWGNDAIGVFMTDHGTTAVSGSAANRQYTTSGDGNFTAAPGDELFYPQTGSVDFIAYYPYDAKHTALGDIDVTIGDQSRQAAFDLLWAGADNGGKGYTKADKNVALSFDHKLAKIVMNCKADGSVGAANLDDMTATIKGTNSKNTFDLATGTLGEAHTPADVTANKIATADGFGASYDAVVMPGAYGADALSVGFAIGGETFTWNVSEAHAAFEGGNEYTYEVTITRSGVSVTATINPWTPNDRGGVTAQ